MPATRKDAFSPNSSSLILTLSVHWEYPPTPQNVRRSLLGKGFRANPCALAYSWDTTLYPHPVSMMMRDGIIDAHGSMIRSPRGPNWTGCTRMSPSPTSPVYWPRNSSCPRFSVGWLGGATWSSGWYTVWRQSYTRTQFSCICTGNHASAEVPRAWYWSAAARMSATERLFSCIASRAGLGFQTISGRGCQCPHLRNHWLQASHWSLGRPPTLRSDAGLSLSLHSHRHPRHESPRLVRRCSSTCGSKVTRFSIIRRCDPRRRHDLDSGIAASKHKIRRDAALKLMQLRVTVGPCGAGQR